MYLFKKPSDDQINGFIEAQSRLDFTYPSVGSTRDGDHPSGYKVDHNVFILDQDKPLSMRGNEHCASGSITDLTGCDDHPDRCKGFVDSH